ncbi:MAG: hypothetical protein LYZ69_04970 [Nitrososphaerales archaeon]|nr:hypothetical protein [Nitrososphaerales archaeon]
MTDQRKNAFMKRLNWPSILVMVAIIIVYLFGLDGLIAIGALYGIGFILGFHHKQGSEINYS